MSIPSSSRSSLTVLFALHSQFIFASLTFLITAAVTVGFTSVAYSAVEADESVDVILFKDGSTMIDVVVILSTRDQSALSKFSTGLDSPSINLDTKSHAVIFTQ